MAEYITCNECLNCNKSIDVNGKEVWACVNFEDAVGIPVDVTPPNCDGCVNWTDNPKEVGKGIKELKIFIKDFWED